MPMGHILAVLITVSGVLCWDIPSDWQQPVANGDMLFSGDPFIPPAHCPNVGNGQLSYRLCEGEGLHFGGVFIGTHNVSNRRAWLPSVHNVRLGLDPDDQGEVDHVGAALDLSQGIVYNRTMINSQRCPGSLIFELRWFAHQFYPQLLVFEMRSLTPPTTNCVARLFSLEEPSNPLADFHWDVLDPQRPFSTWVRGTILEPEMPGTPPVQVGMMYETMPTSIVFTPTNYLFRYIAVVHSSLESLKTTPWDAARADFLTYDSLSTNILLAAHASSWAALWQPGISIEGNLTVGVAVNSSLYHLLSALRADWPFGISPGGLATNAFDGHSFWDAETWMWPTLALLQPAIAQSLLKYRADRLPAAQVRAAWHGTQGAMYPRESAQTGYDCSNAARAVLGDGAVHVTGHVALAFAHYFDLTGDKQWLSAEGWPVYQAACAFFASRAAQFNGSYTYRTVVPPDEAAALLPNGQYGRTVDTSAFTNAVGATVLRRGVELASIVNAQPPPEWSTVGSGLVVPTSTQLWPNHTVHPEYAGYSGQPPSQADVVLLQYPLQWPMDAATAVADATYYYQRSQSEDSWTGGAAYAIALLGQGERAISDAIWEETLRHVDLAHFGVWADVGKGANFLKGAGGFLQHLINGYGGARIQKDQLRFDPSLPPSGVTRVTLRQVTYRGAQFSFSFTGSTITAQQLSGPALVMVDAAGQKHTLGAGVTIPLGPVGVQLA